jgi:hypothetical protein
MQSMVIHLEFLEMLKISWVAAIAENDAQN